MDKKSKILILTLVVLILASLYMTYYRSFISRDFEIIDEGKSAATAEALPFRKR